MYQVISQIVVYISLAAIIGFIIGWLFFKLRSNEKGESIEHILNDELAIVKAKNNELEDELIAKSSEYSKLIESNEELKKRYLTLEMDYEELLKQTSESSVDDEYVQKLENEKFKLSQKDSTIDTIDYTNDKILNTIFNQYLPQNSQTTTITNQETNTNKKEIRHLIEQISDTNDEKDKQEIENDPNLTQEQKEEKLEKLIEKLHFII